MAYIEENIKKRRGADEDEEMEKGTGPKLFDVQDELFNLPEKFRTQPAKPVEEGNVTNSLAMLTAIPEVDLGMECVSFSSLSSFEVGVVTDLDLYFMIGVIVRV